MGVFTVDLGEDRGWAEVTIAGTTKRIDVGRVHGQLYELQRQASGRPGAFYDAASKLLAELGFDAPSHTMTVGFVSFLNGVMGANDQAEAAADKQAEAAQQTPAPAVPTPA